MFEKLITSNCVPEDIAKACMAKYRQKIDSNTAYIKVNGIDLPEIDAWIWNR
jgi:phosphoketolase